MASQGYLETLYLTEQYLAGQVQEYLGVQVELKIYEEDLLGSQVDMEIQDEMPVYSQIEGKLYKHLDLGAQIELKIYKQSPLASQIELLILDSNVISTQIEMMINYDNPVSTQINRKLYHVAELGSQIDLEIQDSLSVSSQIELAILDENSVSAQIEGKLYKQPYVGSQIDLRIDHEYEMGSEVELVILDDTTFGAQIEKIAANYDRLPTEIERFIEDRLHQLSTQVDLEIQDELLIGSQVDLEVMETNAVGIQIARYIEDLTVPMGVEVIRGKLLHLTCPRYLMRGYLTDAYLADCYSAPMGSQVDLKVRLRIPTGLQIELKLQKIRSVPTQVESRIYFEDDLATQVEMQKGTISKVSNQIDLLIKSTNTFGSQIEMKLYKHRDVGSQVNMHIIKSSDDRYIPVQVNMHIIQGDIYLSQILKLIQPDPNNPLTPHLLGMQIFKSFESRIPIQINKVLYNAVQLRILTDFANRGLPGQNGETWTNEVPNGIAEGDYHPNNLNTDILEQITKTAEGIREFNVWCDTGKANTFVDTIAILNHNFTKGAVVNILGYASSVLDPPGITITPTVELENTYWVSPEIPGTPYRYWRIQVLDYGNPDPLQMGIVVLGTSKIVTFTETFENPVTFGFKHFKDTIETEGFSPVSNDRAIRKFLSLSFSMLKYGGGNYRMFRDYFVTNRTDLKALVIPRPTNPSSLAVFSKLSQLPSESHTSISDEEHYVTLTLDFDESL